MATQEKFGKLYQVAFGSSPNATQSSSPRAKRALACLGHCRGGATCRRVGIGRERITHTKGGGAPKHTTTKPHGARERGKGLTPKHPEETGEEAGTQKNCDAHGQVVQ